jgi:hypothetical protein
MNDQATRELCRLIDEYGPGLRRTPQMCELLLRQRLAAFPEATAALITILRLGVLDKLAKAAPDRQAALIAEAVQESQLDPEPAHWAIDAWLEALQGSGPPVSAPSAGAVLPSDAEPPPAGQSLYQRAIVHLIVVTLAGAVGAALPGVQVGLAIQHDMTGRVREMTSQWVGGKNGGQFALLCGSLGLLAGAVGGCVGWMVGGAQDTSYMVHGGTTLGRLGGATVGAFLLARIGAVVGLLFAGPIGVFVGGIVGAALGAFLGYLIGAFILLFLFLCLCL